MKKSVLFVIPHLNGGGAEKVLIDVLNNFDYDKYNVDLLLLFEEGVYLHDIPKEVNVIYLIKKIKLSKRVPWKFKELFYKYIKLFGAKGIYKLVIKKKYDFEIAFLEGAATKFVSGSYNTKSKKITWVHIDLLNNHWTDRFYRSINEEIETYKKFSNIICVSEEAKKCFIDQFGEFNNLSVIYNPLDIEKIKKMANEPIEKDDIFTICAVGRLTPQKGFDRLICATKKLVSENISLRVQILGDGVEKSNLESMVKEYNLNESIKFLGFDQNPYKYIKNCDLFVSSSRNEGFSLVVAEALILNKPIVATKCAGPVEILKNNEYGVICDNSEEGIYNAIKMLYNDEQKRNNFIVKSYEREKFFIIEDKMKKIYELL